MSTCSTSFAQSIEHDGRKTMMKKYKWSRETMGTKSVQKEGLLLHGSRPQVFIYVTQ